jgi:hypothetical protein
MIEVQDIFRQYGESYRKKYAGKISSVQYKVMRHIMMCRTAELGGHVDHCDACGHERISYNSCRDRHCPKCQFLKKEKWLEDRLNDFLPINYFHVVFTVPDILNPIILNNQKRMYDIFFRCVSETLKEFSWDAKYLSAHIGFISVLHTWGQNLSFHPHIHCIVTGGGLSANKSKWINSREQYLFPVKAMGALFRGKYLHFMKQEYKYGSVKTELSEIEFSELINELYKKSWVVYSKPPFKKPETVFKYLAGYTHRIAISNHRIVAIKDEQVIFKWRDYADNNKKKIMSLHAHEFIRRFLLHVLPERYVKIRHFGLFGNRNRKKLLETCRKILKVSDDFHARNVETWKETFHRLTGIDINCCPECGKGTMIIVREIEPWNNRGP